MHDYGLQRSSYNGALVAETFTCFLDLPPRELHQNTARVGHWSVKSKAVKLYRSAAHAMAIAAGRPRSCPWRAARLSVQFRVPDKRRRDVLNYLAALKSGIDGIVDAGVLVDDDKLEIGSVYMMVDRDLEGVVMRFDKI